MDGNCSVGDLKSELNRRGIDCSMCVEKRELLELLQGKIAPIASAATQSRQSVAELKEELKKLGVNIAGCVERQELLDMLQLYCPGKASDGVQSLVPTRLASHVVVAPPRSVQDLQAELGRLGIDYSDCLERDDLLRRLTAARDAASATGALSTHPHGLGRLSTLNRGVLLAAFRGTLALQGTQVDYVDMRRGTAAEPLALEDAVEPPRLIRAPKRQLLALEDSMRDAPAVIALEDGELEAYQTARNSAYRTAATCGSACTVLALPAAERVGTDAYMALLAYRHGPVATLSPTPTLKELRTAYGQHRIFERLEIDVNLFDGRWDLDLTQPPFTEPKYIDRPRTRGGLPYRRPLGWHRFGLQVECRFADRDWLASDGREGEWPVAYHGTTAYAARPIAADGLRAGGRGCSSNPSMKHGAIFGNGVYCTPLAEHAAFFAEAAAVETDEGTSFFQVVFQCRVQPGSFEAHKDFGGGDIFVVKSEADIRPYAVLLSECSADGVDVSECRQQQPTGF